MNEDSSKSSESSSEEKLTHSGPPETAITGTGVPESIEESDPLDILPSDDLELSSAAPHLEDPQTSTDIDISHDVPNLDPAQNSVDFTTPHALPDVEASLHPGLLQNDQIQITKETEVTVAQPVFLQGATLSTPLSFSTVTPLTIPFGASLTGAPVCFTIQFTTPEPPPPRGDSI